MLPKILECFASLAWAVPAKSHSGQIGLRNKCLRLQGSPSKVVGIPKSVASAGKEGPEATRTWHLELTLLANGKRISADMLGVVTNYRYSVGSFHLNIALGHIWPGSTCLQVLCKSNSRGSRTHSQSFPARSDMCLHHRSLKLRGHLRDLNLNVLKPSRYRPASSMTHVEAFLIGSCSRNASYIESMSERNATANAFDRIGFNITGT